MSQEIRETRPPNEYETLLCKKFYEDIAAQSDRVDALSAHLLTLELAVPGLYATALKLIRGSDATLHNSAAIMWTFVFWALALISTLAALTPKTWKVNSRVFKQEESLMETEGMGIEDYFSRSAQYKRRLAFLSAIFFFAGIVCAVGGI